MFTAADLATAPGRTLTFALQLEQPGAVYLNAYAATPGFPLVAVRGCLQQAAQPACTPTTMPDPAYWPVTAADLSHATDYRLVVTVTQSSTALLGLHVGWDGAHQISIGGLRLPGGCTTSTGYKAGCGLRAHVDLGPGGPVTVSTATAGLHATVKDKTAGTKLASETLRGSLTVTMPATHEWALHLLPDNGAAVPTLSLSVRWP